ncbi:protein of unknown function (plasmid) [Cupriavidus taiwanensis]|nr:protein of unknown function [Cupriavidus taiwanensis]
MATQELHGCHYPPLTARQWRDVALTD